MYRPSGDTAGPSVFRLSGSAMSWTPLPPSTWNSFSLGSPERRNAPIAATT